MDVRLSMAEMLSNRQEYEYSFAYYLLGYFAWIDSWRCRKAARLRQLHDESVRRLLKEIDVVSFVRD